MRSSSPSSSSPSSCCSSAKRAGASLLPSDGPETSGWIPSSSSSSPSPSSELDRTASSVSFSGCLGGAAASSAATSLSSNAPATPLSLPTKAFFRPAERKSAVTDTLREGGPSAGSRCSVRRLEPESSAAVGGRKDTCRLLFLSRTRSSASITSSRANPAMSLVNSSPAPAPGPAAAAVSVPSPREVAAGGARGGSGRLTPPRGAHAGGEHPEHLPRRRHLGFGGAPPPPRVVVGGGQLPQGAPSPPGSNPQPGPPLGFSLSLSCLGLGLGQGVRGHGRGRGARAGRAGGNNPVFASPPGRSVECPTRIAIAIAIATLLPAAGLPLTRQPKEEARRRTSFN